MLEIPLDKEFTANCLVETRTKLEELIPASMVDYGLNRVQRSLWLRLSLIKWFLMVWFTLGYSGQRTTVKCAEAVWNTKQGPSALEITCGFFNHLRFLYKVDPLHQS